MTAGSYVVAITGYSEDVEFSIVFGAMGVVWLVAYRSIGGPK